MFCSSTKNHFKGRKGKGAGWNEIGLHLKSWLISGQRQKENVTELKTSRETRKTNKRTVEGKKRANERKTEHTCAINNCAVNKTHKKHIPAALENHLFNRRFIYVCCLAVIRPFHFISCSVCLMWTNKNRMMDITNAKLFFFNYYFRWNKAWGCPAWNGWN